MTFDKRRIVTTCDELLNHSGWRELVNCRSKSKGFGNLWLRSFELDCGNNFFIRIYQTECMSLSLISREFSKPYVATFFSTTRGRFGSACTHIADCTDRNLFYLRLYRTLSERFPL